MKPHKHAELSKAWADGAEIQYRYVKNDYEWLDDDEPEWYRDDFEFRIKPEPKPDVELNHGGWVAEEKVNGKTEYFYSKFREHLPFRLYYCAIPLYKKVNHE